MNSPQRDETSASCVPITDVRNQIDSIDADIAALVVRRCGLSASVAAAKQAGGDHAFGWRPAREVEILRSLFSQQASLDPELAFTIWRALISANLANQGNLTIFTLSEAETCAKATFSVGTQPEVLANASDLFDAIACDDHAIGVLPWPDASNWWVTMMEPQFASLYVCAASPLAGKSPQALLIAARAPEAAGEDIALIGGPCGAIDGGIIAQVNGLALVACGEFISPDTPLPQGCRLIGNFALA
jgi:chorismate mutase